MAQPSPSIVLEKVYHFTRSWRPGTLRYYRLPRRSQRYVRRSQPATLVETATHPDADPGPRFTTREKKGSILQCKFGRPDRRLFPLPPFSRSLSVYLCRSTSVSWLLSRSMSAATIRLPLSLHRPIQGGVVLAGYGRADVVTTSCLSPEGFFSRPSYLAAFLLKKCLKFDLFLTDAMCA